MRWLGFGGVFVVAGCSGGAHNTPPRDHDLIVIDLAKQRVHTPDHEFLTHADAVQLTTAVENMSFGLSAPQPQVTTHPSPDDGLPPECDTPRTLLTDMTELYSHSDTGCSGQLDELPMGPVVSVQCPLPPKPGSIACPMYYRAFVWGEVDGSVPPVARPGANDRLSFTIKSLAFVSATCGRGDIDVFKPDIDADELERLHHKGETITSYFAKCERPNTAPADAGEGK